MLRLSKNAADQEVDRLIGQVPDAQPIWRVADTEF
jgi:hypothetical protein